METHGCNSVQDTRAKHLLSCDPGDFNINLMSADSYHGNLSLRDLGCDMRSATDADDDEDGEETVPMKTILWKEKLRKLKKLVKSFGFRRQTSKKTH